MHVAAVSVGPAAIRRRGQRGEDLRRDLTGAEPDDLLVIGIHDVEQAAAEVDLVAAVVESFRGYAGVYDAIALSQKPDDPPTAQRAVRLVAGLKAEDFGSPKRDAKIIPGCEKTPLPL